MTKKEYYDFREEDNTREVSLVLLLKCALKKWKIILLVGVILGALMGSYKVLSIHSKKADMIEDYDAYKVKLAAYKQSVKDYRETVEEYQRIIAARKEYLSTSVRMRIDPYNVPTCSVNINVSAAEGEKLSATQLSSIRASINNEILTGNTINEAAQKAGMDTFDLRGLVTSTVANSNTFVRVVVRAETEEQAQEIMGYILEGVEKAHKEIAGNIGEYVITPFGQATTTIPDNSLATAQDKYTESLSKLETASYTAQNQSTQLVKPESVPQYSKKYMLVNGAKMGFVGLILGAGLALIAFMVLLIAKGTIFTGEEIDGEYGLINLADLSGKKFKEAGEEMDYVIAQLENYAAGSALIGLTGLASAKKQATLVTSLNEKAKLAGDQFKFAELGDILSDAGALRSLKATEGVILVEEIGKSEYNDIRREIAIMMESGCKLIGTIYF